MKNSKFKELTRDFKELIIILTFATLIIFSAYIFFGYEYKLTFSNDHIFQMNQFYTEYIRIIQKSIEAKSPIFYSWNTYLGNNFYAAKAYYCTGDLLVIIAALIFKNLKATSFLLFESIFCIYLSALLINVYLKKININKKYIRIIYSLIYSLGGCTLIYLQYPMFLRFYAILPLLFIGVENYLKNNKLLIFSISVTLLLLQNYYFMVPTTLFLPVYFLLRSYILDSNNKFNIKKYLFNSVNLIISYLIGLCVSMVLILPAFYFIVGSNRLSYNEIQSLFTWPLKTWISLIYYTLMPVFTTFIDQPFLTNLETETPSITNYYSLYIGSVGFIGLVSFFSNEINKKKAYIAVLLILMSANMFLPLCSLLHMNTTPTLRFTFILFFYIFVLSAIGFDNYNSYTNKNVFYSTFLILFITCLICIFKLINLSFLLILLSLVISIFFETRFFENKYLIIALMLVELISFGTYYISAYPFEEYNDDLNENQFTYYKEQDEDKLYRTAIPSELIIPYGASEINLNYPLIYNYMGLSTYDTTYEYSLEEFIKFSKSKKANNIIDSNNENLYQLLGVKYIVFNPGEEVDNNLYEYAYKLGDFDVYKLKNYNHLGHTYSSFVYNAENINLNTDLLIDENLKNLVSDIIKNEKQQLIIDSQLSDNNFNGHLELNSKQILLISIPYDSGWRFYDNGTLIESYSVDEGLTGLILNSGYHEIEAWYQPPGFKTGFIISAIGLVGYLILIIKDKKSSNI